MSPRFANPHHLKAIAVWFEHHVQAVNAVDAKVLGPAYWISRRKRPLFEDPSRNCRIKLKCAAKKFRLHLFSGPGFDPVV